MPLTVFLNKDPTPCTIPNPPSNGPLTNPSAGFVIRSENPSPIVLKSPIGFPIKSIDPSKKNTYYNKLSLYLIVNF